MFVLKNANERCSHCGKPTRNISRILGVNLRICKRCQPIVVAEALKKHGQVKRQTSKT
jgi:hypothetical protein